MHHFHYHHHQLYAEDLPLESLVKKYGTPLYVYSAQTFLDHLNKLNAALAPLPHEVCYAVKANSNIGVLHLLAKAGAWFDIVSAGELQRVLKAGGKAANCTFAGVGKTAKEIQLALKEGVYCFNVESEAELLFINEIAGKMKKKAPVAIRVNPNVDAGTHAKITTGTYENKFGIAYELVPKLYAKAAHLKHLHLKGVQMHIGSQITRLKPFEDAVKKMVPLVLDLKKKYGIEFFDIGGGIGIVYDSSLQSGQVAWWNKKKEKPLTPAIFAEALIPLLKPLGLKILTEPGRFICGNAGVLLSEVLYIKKTAKKTFVVVDAAMNDLIRPAFYEAYHEIVPLKEKKTKGSQVLSDVVGPICESGDIFCKDRPLPALKAGDQVSFMSAGAYGFTMASNYNTRPRPAEILVHGKKAKLVRKRETFEDMIKGESV